MEEGELQMSQVIPVLFVALGAIEAIVVADVMGVTNEYTSILIAVLGGVIMLGVWFVSPLPVETGGMIGGKPQSRKWGFTMEKQEEE